MWRESMAEKQSMVTLSEKKIFGFDNAYYFNIIERIQIVTGARTQVELAAILGIKQSSISDAKKRKSVPADWYMKLFEKLGVNPDWLKKGIGPVYLRTEAGYIPDNNGSKIISPELLADPASCSELVTVYSLYNEYINQPFSLMKFNSIGKLSVPKIYIKKGIIVLKIDNNSSSPTILNGAYVGVDTFSKYPISGELFAVYIPHEGIVLRRLFWKQKENCFVLQTENKEFPEIYISYEQKDLILGRLSWIMQKI